MSSIVFFTIFSFFFFGTIHKLNKATIHRRRKKSMKGQNGLLINDRETIFIRFYSMILWMKNLLIKVIINGFYWVTLNFFLFIMNIVNYLPSYIALFLSYFKGNHFTFSFLITSSLLLLYNFFCIKKQSSRNS